jgi:AcrR family transcriptional regulator
MAVGDAPAKRAKRVPRTPSGTKWDEKRAASYEAVVRAAHHVFHERGYSATTVADIVARTPYSSGAFYFHFANKADCFWHVMALRERLRGDWYALARETDPSRTSLDALLRQVLGHFARAQEGVVGWTLVVADFARQHGDDRDTQARLKEAYAGWQADIRGFVTLLHDRGWVTDERDASLVAIELFAYGEGLTAHATLYGIDPAVAADAQIDGLVKLLRG